MRVKELIHILKRCKENLPIAIIDNDDHIMYLSWNFTNDGPEQKMFSFVLRNCPSPYLDTLGAKLILEYCISVMDEKLEDFIEYNVGVSWAVSKPGDDADCPFRVKTRLEEIEAAFYAVDLDGKGKKTMLAFKVKSLPGYEEVESWS